MVPKAETNKVGHTQNFENADEVSFNQVYLASDKDTSESINAKLNEGLHVVL
jgi:hypothetical protein